MFVIIGLYSDYLESRNKSRSCISSKDSSVQCPFISSDWLWDIDETSRIFCCNKRFSLYGAHSIKSLQTCLYNANITRTLEERSWFFLLQLEAWKRIFVTYYPLHDFVAWSLLSSSSLNTTLGGNLR